MSSQPTPVVLITGAAQGIGKGVSRYLLERGYTVVMADRDEDAGARTLAEYGPLAQPGQLHFVPVDIAEEASVNAALDWVATGLGQLDELVHNAAISPPPARCNRSRTAKPTPPPRGAWWR